MNAPFSVWPEPYHPCRTRYLSFAKLRYAFSERTDSPRHFLERCFERAAEVEPLVKAFVCADWDGARNAADLTSRRWREGRQLSLVDGLPIGIKDCFDVRGMPTRVNSPLFDGAVPCQIDCAHVAALRQSGAVIVGKTVTTELTMAEPGPTWNPWELARTPGGSSSGSAAAVAAGVLPVATGSQVRGSVIRPASLCGIVGMKPTPGALNSLGGFGPSPSLNHLGLLGGTLQDVWEAAHQIAQGAGGDPGFKVLGSSGELPEPRRPARLLRQYTCGWEKTDEASKAAFEGFLRRLAKAGLEVVEPRVSEELAAYERDTTALPEFFFDLMLWEIRWPLLAWRDMKPDAFSPTMHGHLRGAEKLTPLDYSRALGRRDVLRDRHRRLAGKVDGMITLAHIGPAQPGQPALGTPWYNDASSAIGAPTYNLPLLVADGMPLGVQLMGFEGGDADLASLTRWMLAAFAPQETGAFTNQQDA